MKRMLVVLALAMLAVTGWSNGVSAATDPTVARPSVGISSPLIAQGDDNGSMSTYGLPPLVPQGDDNGSMSTYGLPPLVPQGDDNGSM